MISKGPISMYTGNIQYIDLDKDGHSDLIVTLQATSGSKRHVRVLKNVPCEESSLISDVGAGCRIFQSRPDSDTEWITYFNKIENAESFAIAAFDFGEQG